MNIAFDLDGVLYDWHHALHVECLIYEKNVPEDFENFWLEYIPTKSSMALEYYTNLQHLYSNQPPCDWRVKMLKEISKYHNIYYITNRPKDVKTTTESYLKRYDFPQRENLFFTDDKTIEARALEIDLFVEDRENNLEALSKFTDVVAVLQPWNRHLIGRFNFIEKITDLAVDYALA